MKEIIQGIDQTRFDRAHFAAFGDSALNFEVVYYVLDPDYNLSMDIQQQINLTLVRKLDELGVSFALPSRTLYVEGTSSPYAPRCNCSRAAAGSGLTTPKAIEKAKHTLPDYSASPACCDPPYLSAVGKPDDSDPLTRRASFLEKVDVVILFDAPQP